MFPSEDLANNTLKIVKSINNSTSKTIKQNLVYNFEDKKIVLVDGIVKENCDIEATKQWITTFLITMRDCTMVYNGTKFGTSFKKIRGIKTLTNGFYESEIEREIQEGFLLCPSIKQITSYNMYKDGKNLVIELGVELYSGDIIDINEVVYVY